MNEVQVFQNPDFGQIRSVVIDGEPWFIGTDVSTTLGYADNAKALKQHIDDDDKRIFKPGELSGLKIGNRGAYIINESGLYSLILSSKLPEAKKFKRWVTSEVLPCLRKTGAYAVHNASQRPVDDEAEQRALTPDDYFTAARILSTCRNERLPYVLALLEKGGIELDDLSGRSLPALTCPRIDLTGLEDFIKKPVPGDWQKYTLEQRLAYWDSKKAKVSTVPRRHICAAEVWREMLREHGDMSKAISRTINSAIEAIVPDWRRGVTIVGPYKQQRAFIKD